MTAASAFDRLAPRYDETWTESPIGRAQREAVWRRIDPLFRPGERVLDLGCGTGEDALHLMRSGVRVTAIDASSAMVEIARGKGVDARHLPIERAGELSGLFHGALSNFGAFNCIEKIDAAALARLIAPRGYLAICLCGPFCAWETCHYLRRRDWKRAFRRLRRGGVTASFGVRVRYPGIRELLRVFNPYFTLTGWYGIGLFVPPSYVGTLRGSAIDRRLAHWPVLRAMADHRLLVLQRA